MGVRSRGLGVGCEESGVGGGALRVSPPVVSGGMDKTLPRGVPRGIAISTLTPNASHQTLWINSLPCRDSNTNPGKRLAPRGEYCPI